MKSLNPQSISANLRKLITEFIETVNQKESKGHSISWEDLDGNKWETDQGFTHIEIQGTNLLIEDSLGNGDQDDEDQSYHIVSMDNLKSIQYN